MKKSTIENIKSVITALKAENVQTPASVSEKTKLNLHQLNALQACWANGQGGAVTSPALWERKTVQGNVFLVLTKDGAAWQVPTSKAPAKKAPAMPEEEARLALLAELEGTVVATVATGNVEHAEA